MTKKEALVKALIWRFGVAIPVSIVIAYNYLGNMSEALELSIFANVVSTVLYWAFDLFWFKRVSSRFNNDNHSYNKII